MNTNRPDTVTPYVPPHEALRQKVCQTAKKRGLTSGVIATAVGCSQSKAWNMMNQAGAKGEAGLMDNIVQFVLDGEQPAVGAVDQPTDTHRADARHLRLACAHCGLSVAEVATKADCSTDSVLRVLNGEIENVSQDLVTRVITQIKIALGKNLPQVKLELRAVSDRLEELESIHDRLEKRYPAPIIACKR